MTLRRTAAWVVVVALGVLATLRAIAQPWSAPQPTSGNIDLTAGQDFRDATYYPLRELLSGGDPYLPTNMLENWPVRQEFGLYAPSHLVTSMPFAALDYRPSLMVFSLLSIACLFAIGIVPARTYALPGGWLSAWLVGGLVVLSQLGKWALYFGQINAVVGLGGVLALTQARRRPAWAAIGLALAWTKPQFGIPLVIVLLARRAWREGIGGTALAFVVSLPIVGVLVAREGLVGFVDVLRANIDYSSSVYYTAVDSMIGTRIDGAAVFYRLTGWIPPFAEGIVFVVVMALAAVILGRRRGPFGPAELLLASTACLICIVHQQRETLIAVPGIVAVAVSLLRRERLPGLVVAASVLALLPAAHFTFVENVLRTTISPWFDGIWEGVVLIVAFGLLVVSSTISRGPGRLPREARDERSRPHDPEPDLA